MRPVASPPVPSGGGLDKSTVPTKYSVRIVAAGVAGGGAWCDGCGKGQFNMASGVHAAQIATPLCLDAEVPGSAAPTAILVGSAQESSGQNHQPTLTCLDSSSYKVMIWLLRFHSVFRSTLAEAKPAKIAHTKVASTMGES
jgi:hypothetical protein